MPRSLDQRNSSGGSFLRRWRRSGPRYEAEVGFIEDGGTVRTFPAHEGYPRKGSGVWFARIRRADEVAWETRSPGTMRNLNHVDESPAEQWWNLLEGMEAMGVSLQEVCAKLNGTGLGFVTTREPDGYGGTRLRLVQRELIPIAVQNQAHEPCPPIRYAEDGIFKFEITPHGVDVETAVLYDRTFDPSESTELSVAHGDLLTIEVSGNEQRADKAVDAAVAREAVLADMRESSILCRHLDGLAADFRALHL
jgi:hypothetical protein